MRVIVSGGTGFIGRAVVARLLQDRHSVSIWSRTPDKERRAGVSAFYWNPLEGEPSDDSLPGCDAVVHLAGEPVAQRWTAGAKERIRNSRVGGTERLARA